MNILSFIAGILIIFSIISTHMLKNHRDSWQIFKSINGYQKEDLNAQNEYERILYDSHKSKKKTSEKDTEKPIDFPKNDEKTNKKEKKSDDKETLPKKKKTPKKIFSCGCINLAKFLDENNSEENFILKKYVLKILYTHYIDEFNNKLTPEKFLNSLIINLKSNKNLNELTKLSFKNKKEQIIWYFLLQGTNDYSFKEKIGAPSILYFVTFDKTNVKNKICINKSSKELLHIFFNKEIASELCTQIDKKKNIKKDFLENLLLNDLYRKEKIVSSAIDLFSFNHSKNDTKCCILARDKKNKVKIIKHFNN